MNLTKKQLYLLAIGAVILIAAVAAGAMYFSPKPADQGNQNEALANQPEITATSTAATSTEATTTPAVKKPAVKVAPQPAKPALTYDQAKEIYAGRKFQFNASCQIAPMSMVVKNSTTIMLDNRSEASRTITIGSKKYIVKANNFLLVNITAPAPYPQNLSIACNSQYNVGKITVAQ